ncbi:MAG: hypothetical protein QOE71_4150 [Pseudonocardiales bacterium]|jgi:hypothetical protein|nr:hypothetical protein [Pseudonocardiales bacterium]
MVDGTEPDVRRTLAFRSTGVRVAHMIHSYHRPYFARTSRI